MSSVMDIDVLDLLVQEDDLEELLQSSLCPFTFSSGMGCPVVACGLYTFTSRKSYARHWESRHKPSTTTFFCSVPGCRVTCKRRTDMRYHLRTIHHLQNLHLENQLQQCNHQVLPNKNFIDPGSLKFLSNLPRKKTDTTSNSEIPINVSAPDIPSATVSSMPSLLDSSTSVSDLCSRSSLLDQPAVVSSIPESITTSSIDTSSITTSSICSSTTQTVLPDITVTHSMVQTEAVPSPLSFDHVPAGKEELDLFVININVEIERLQRMRDLANTRLSERSELERERELRRKIESENRKLKSELASMKGRESEFENCFARDERFEMFERADGTLDCYRRESTHLANRLGKRVELKPHRIFTEE